MAVQRSVIATTKRKNATDFLYLFMKEVAILVPRSCVMQAIADPQYCLSAVNMFIVQSGRQPLFNIRLVAAEREVSLNGGTFTVRTDLLLEECKKADLVFIPALSGDLRHAVEINEAMVPWVLHQYDQGADIASLCLGAFLLARTGLVDGKKCSTHWGFINQFREMFPQVDVQEGRIITEENRIYSSGGANSYWNLLLHLVEKYTDRATAVLVSKYFAIDINRDSQSVFSIFQGQKGHEDEAIRLAQEYIEKNIEARITVEELADRVSVGKRSFERRFRKATNNSVLEYIQRVKVEAAKRTFETSQKNVNEVMFDVGYTDTKAFRTTFRKVTGLSPAEYRNKYNKISDFQLQATT